MNCRYVQSHLSAYIDMELTGIEQQRFRAHLECCLECSAEYETLLRVKHLMRHLPTVAPLRSGEEVMLQRIQEYRMAQRAPRRTLFHTRWWRYAWGAAAVALAIWLTPREENKQLRPIQSDALTTSLTSPYSKRTFSFPPLRRSESNPLVSSSNMSPHTPVILLSPEPFGPIPPNPVIMPVVENRWGTTGTLQPTFELQPR
ncbi:hypothetical protein HRbin15_00983 [bacterium HR15]|nr:hypothetical protein HRbin15_00983 [bacterium HR15]